MNKIAGLPRILQAPTRQLVQKPLARPWRGRPDQRHYLANQLGQIRNFEPAEISQAQINWLEAVVTPCVVAAAAEFLPDGRVTRASVGHFSTNTVDYDLPHMLEDYEPANSLFYFAGLANRSSAARLKLTCERLAQNLTRPGWPVRLGWQMPDRPEFIRLTGDSSVKISDIGFGLAGSIKSLRGTITRRILLALTEHDLAFYSQTFLGSAKAGKTPYDFILFHRDLGKVSLVAAAEEEG